VGGPDIAWSKGPNSSVTIADLCVSKG